MCQDQTKAQRKKIFEPANVDELVRGWVLHAHKGRDRHDVAARQNDRYHLWLGIPTVVSSAIIGTSIFASLGQQVEPDDPRIILLGLLSVAAVVLASLQTFFDFGNRAEIHRATGVKYKVIIRQLEQILSQMEKDLDSEDDRLKRIKDALDVLEEEAPIVPYEIYDRIESTYNSNVEIVKEAIKLYAP